MVKRKNVILMFAVLFFAVFFSTIKTAHAKTPVNGERIAGSDRYLTSINISQSGWSGTSEIAIIATGKDFPDALSASPLAKKYNAPILLTDTDYLSPKLSEELSRLKTKRVFIIGGTGAVSLNIENQLSAKGILCTRLSGKDRYETSVAVARELSKNSRIFVATGNDFPDALSVASIAANSGIPILLTDRDKLPLTVESYLKENNITASYVIGGSGVVSDSVMHQLTNAERIYGNDRFATNAAVISKFSSDYDFGRLYIATGNDFPDALSGSALAALTKSPVVLADTGLLSQTKAFMDSKVNNINDVYILGGDGVVSNSAIAGVAPPMIIKVEIKVPYPVVSLNKEIKASADITMIPDNAAKPGISYSSGSPDILSVSQEGAIRGLKPGKATVTVTAGKKTASVDILVREGRLIVLDPGHGGDSPGAVPSSQDGRTKLVEYRESVLTLNTVEKIRTRLQAQGFTVVLTREGDTTASLEERAALANSLMPDLFLSIHYDSSTSRTANGTTAYYSSFKPGVSSGTFYVYALGAGPAYDVNGKYIGNVVSGSKYSYIDTVVDEKGDSQVLFNFNGSTARVPVKADYITVRDDAPTTIALQSKDLAERISSAIASVGLVNKGIRENDFAVNRWTNMPSVLAEVGYISNWNEFQKITQDSFQNQIADKIVQAIVDFYKYNNI